MYVYQGVLAPDLHGNPWSYTPGIPFSLEQVAVPYGKRHPEDIMEPCILKERERESVWEKAV
jgi:hypothetical protein